MVAAERRIPTAKLAYSAENCKEMIAAWKVAAAVAAYAVATATASVADAPPSSVVA